MNGILKIDLESTTLYIVIKLNEDIELNHKLINSAIRMPGEIIIIGKPDKKLNQLIKDFNIKVYPENTEIPTGDNIFCLSNGCKA